MNGMAKKKATPAQPVNPWPARLKALREFYDDMSQTDAAAKVRVPIGTWRNWEQGRRPLPDHVTLLLELTFPEFFRIS